MELDNRKRTVKLKHVAIAELLLSLGYFAFIMLACSCVVTYYAGVEPSEKFRPLFSQTVHGLDYSWQIFCLVCGVILLGLSHFEVRLLTADNKRFLGYKAYILFFYKVLYLPASLGLAVLTSLYCAPEFYVYAPVLLAPVAGYYVLLGFFTFKYRRCLGGYLYLSFLQSVKQWWIEGKLAIPAPPEKKKSKPSPEPAETETPAPAGAESALPRRRIGGKETHTVESVQAPEPAATPEKTSEPETQPAEPENAAAPAQENGTAENAGEEEPTPAKAQDKK